MMLTRRTLLAVAVSATAILTKVDRVAAERISRAPLALRIFDSRLPISLAWLDSNPGCAIDVAHEHSNRWSTLRAGAPEGCVAGLTTWSDYVQVRGSLEQNGKRLRREARREELFYWEMI